MSMLNVLMALAAVAALMGVGYVAACAGAERWLTLREWLVLTTCNHTHVRLLAIGFDGETVYECTACGKRFRRGL